MDSESKNNLLQNYKNELNQYYSIKNFFEIEEILKQNDLHKGRKNRDIISDITYLVNEFGLPQKISEIAIKIYQEYLQKRSMNNCYDEMLISIFISCKMNNIPMTFKEIFGQKKVYKLYNKFCFTLNIKTLNIPLINYFNKYIFALNYDNDDVTKIFEILEKFLSDERVKKLDSIGSNKYAIITCFFNRISDYFPSITFKDQIEICRVIPTTPVSQRKYKNMINLILHDITPKIKSRSLFDYFEKNN